jgi:hypothetical protein
MSVTLARVLDNAPRQEGITSLVRSVLTNRWERRLATDIVAMDIVTLVEQLRELFPQGQGYGGQVFDNDMRLGVAMALQELLKRMQISGQPDVAPAPSVRECRQKLEEVAEETYDDGNPRVPPGRVYRFIQLGHGSNARLRGPVILYGGRIDSAQAYGALYAPPGVRPYTSSPGVETVNLPWPDLMEYAALSAS